MLRAQHPDYKIFLIGTHGQRVLVCNDCHMPYISEGGLKYSNHRIMTPLKNVASTCQTCHRDTEETLKKYVYEYQDKALEIRNRVEEELAKAHVAKSIIQLAMADISTKAKAQAYIGLEMDKLRREKDQWVKTVVLRWLSEAKQIGRL